VEERGSLENRKCVRVTVPDALFVEGALWIRPPHTPTRLHLSELGAPQLRFAQGSPLLRIDDLSANGLRLTLGRPQGLGEGLAALKSGNCLVFLHLKLHQPLTSVEERPLSLFLGAEPVSLREEENGAIVLALNILYRGQPNRDEKSMTFFYVAKYPIRELAAWCDEVTMMDRARSRPAARGLRMDRFLLELDSVLEREENGGQPQNQEPGN